MEVDSVENEQLSIKKEEYANVFKKSASIKEQTSLANLLNNSHVWEKAFICNIRFFRGFRQLCNFIVVEDIDLSLSDGLSDVSASFYYLFEVSVLGEVLKLLKQQLNITAALKFPRKTRSCTRKLGEDRVKSYMLIVSDQPNAIDTKVFSTFYVNDTLIVKPIYQTRMDVSFYFDFNTISDSIESQGPLGDSSRKLCESTLNIGIQVDMLDVFKVIMKNADHLIEPNQVKRLLSANFNRELKQAQHVFVSNYNENADISIDLIAKRIKVSSFDCTLVEEIVDYLQVHFK